MFKYANFLKGNKYNRSMWMNNYCDYHQFLFELEEYGDTDYLSKNFPLFALNSPLAPLKPSINI